MIHREFKNVQVHATVGYHDCHFRSKFEHKWARYLQWLLEAEQIDDWMYESQTFHFPDETRGPHHYLPDFRVVENDGTIVWQETKGHHDGATNAKFQRMAKHYPDEVCELVLMQFRKGDAINRRGIARKYVRRVIDASEIFKQMKGLL